MYEYIHVHSTNKSSFSFFLFSQIFTRDFSAHRRCMCIYCWKCKEKRESSGDTQSCVLSPQARFMKENLMFLCVDEIAANMSRKMFPNYVWTFLSTFSPFLFIVCTWDRDSGLFYCCYIYKCIPVSLAIAMVGPSIRLFAASSFINFLEGK